MKHRTPRRNPSGEPQHAGPKARRSRGVPRCKSEAGGRAIRGPKAFSPTRETPREPQPKPLPSRGSPCLLRLSARLAALPRPKPERSMALQNPIPGPKTRYRRPRGGCIRLSANAPLDRGATLASHMPPNWLPASATPHCTCARRRGSCRSAAGFSRFCILFREPMFGPPKPTRGRRSLPWD